MNMMNTNMLVVVLNNLFNFRDMEFLYLKLTERSNDFLSKNVELNNHDDKKKIITYQILSLIEVR